MGPKQPTVTQVDGSGVEDQEKYYVNRHCSGRLLLTFIVSAFLPLLFASAFAFPPFLLHYGSGLDFSNNISFYIPAFTFPTLT
jgi:hypothetical protein